jgi:hypothetical protein
VAHVAAQRRGAEVVLGGQGAVGDPGQQGPVDLFAVFMDANGTGLRHDTDSRVALRQNAVRATT